MTDDERKLLSDLADRIANTPSPAKDPDAEQFIRTRIGSRPDALYLMTQTVIIQNIALQQAQAQIQQMQHNAGQSAQLGAPSSFIGQGQQQAPPRQTYAPQYAPPPSYAAPSPAPPSPSLPSGAGGFLRGAAQTAAGVAAGALAFEGISSLFHHGMGGGGFFGGGGIGGYAPPIEENVVNNYYEGGDQGGYGDGGNSAPDDYQAADDAAANDQGYDDSGNQFDDNGGGFDDGGGGFDGGGGDNFS